jgi:dGTPase
VAAAMLELKKFNYEFIYRNPAFKPDFDKIHICYTRLFEHYLDQLREGSDTGQSILHSMTEEYVHNQTPAAMVRDYISGMTDDFFLRQSRAIGCEIPERTCLPN